jgi:hypothetical protein
MNSYSTTSLSAPSQCLFLDTLVQDIHGHAIDHRKDMSNFQQKLNSRTRMGSSVGGKTRRCFCSAFSPRRVKGMLLHTPQLEAWIKYDNLESSSPFFFAVVALLLFIYFTFLHLLTCIYIVQATSFLAPQFQAELIPPSCSLTLLKRIHKRWQETHSVFASLR